MLILHLHDRFDEELYLHKRNQAFFERWQDSLSYSNVLNAVLFDDNGVWFVIDCICNLHFLLIRGSYAFRLCVYSQLNGEKHAETKEVFWDPARALAATPAYSGSHFYCLSLARNLTELLGIVLSLWSRATYVSIQIIYPLLPLTKFRAFASHAQDAQHWCGAGASDKKLLLGNAMAVFQERSE